MSELRHCPQCGAKATDQEWSGCIEFCWGMEQSCSVGCAKCDFSVYVLLNPEKLRDGDSHRIEERLRQVWNDLAEDLA